MTSWLDQIIADTIEAESPERFQFWSAVSAIAASLKKNVYLDRYYYKLYPNLYVMLVGKSGLRKGNPVTLAKKIVDHAGVARVIVGRNSIQAVIQELGKAQSIEGGGVMKDANGFLVSGELASFFVKDPEAMTILTDLYDTHAHEPEWKNTLKSGKDTLKNVCLTLLGATNEDHFKEAVAEKDIKGGFIARTLIVLENKRRVINDLMDPPKVVPVITELSCFLKEAAKLSGKFTIGQESKMIYREWYHELAIMKHDDVTGTIERLGDTVLKVAMSLSIANSLDLEIHPAQMQEAISKCIECVGGLKQVTMGAGKSDLAYATSLIMKELIKREGHAATRKQLLAKYWGDVDSITLDKVMETLDGSGAVTCERRGKEIVYTMKAKIVEMYTKFNKEIN